MAKIKQFDPSVQRYKSVLMQRIQWDLEAGYWYWFSGTVSAAKAMGLAQKFADKYRVHVSKSTRFRDRKAGLASAKLHFYPIKESTDLFWLVLLTEGEHPAKIEEKVQDARLKRQRITLWLGDYEAVRIPKKSATGEQQGDSQPVNFSDSNSKMAKKSTTWTWRMTHQTEAFWHDRVLKAVRRKNERDIKSAVYSLQKMPGFSGIRAQAKAIRAEGVAEWKRVFKDTEEAENPFKKAFIPYVRLLKNDLHPLSSLCGRVLKGKRAWFSSN